MAEIQSFALQSGAQPHTLVLGSIPGVASLQAVQYYAHPRNAFWPIMSAFYGFELDQPYQQRLHALLGRGVALWDVLQQCQRPGSLDSAIVTDSIVPNPIDDWLQQQPQVRRILLNGGKAMQVFAKHFAHLLANPDLRIAQLPSTSPAYAAMTLAEKQRRWHAQLV